MSHQSLFVILLIKESSNLIDLGPFEPELSNRSKALIGYHIHFYFPPIPSKAFDVKF